MHKFAKKIIFNPVLSIPWMPKISGALRKEIFFEDFVLNLKVDSCAPVDFSVNKEFPIKRTKTQQKQKAAAVRMYVAYFSHRYPNLKKTHVRAALTLADNDLNDAEFLMRFKNNCIEMQKALKLPLKKRKAVLENTILHENAKAVGPNIMKSSTESSGYCADTENYVYSCSTNSTSEELEKKPEINSSSSFVGCQQNEENIKERPPIPKIVISLKKPNEIRQPELGTFPKKEGLLPVAYMSEASTITIKSENSESDVYKFSESEETILNWKNVRNNIKRVPVRKIGVVIKRQGNVYKSVLL